MEKKEKTKKEKKRKQEKKRKGRKEKKIKKEREKKKKERKNGLLYRILNLPRLTRPALRIVASRTASRTETKRFSNFAETWHT